MKSIKFITILSLLVFVSINNEILKAQTDSISSIKISCSLNWLDIGKMVSNVPGFPAAVASRGFFIKYENINYDDDEVFVITEFHLNTDQGDKVYPRDEVTNETELEDEKGEIQTIWIAYDIKTEGAGNIIIYLTDLDRNIISNKIMVPAACGKKYIEEFYKIYGEPKYSN
jgi:hypothetical protein